MARFLIGLTQERNGIRRDVGSRGYRYVELSSESQESRMILIYIRCTAVVGNYPPRLCVFHYRVDRPGYVNLLYFDRFGAVEI